MQFLNKFKIQYIVLTAIAVHIIAAWYSTGWHHPDEHYQLIEFTYAINQQKDANALPMEFALEMRPSIQVWLTFIIIKASNIAGIFNPFVIAFLLRLLTAFVCIYVSLAFHHSLKIEQYEQNLYHLLLMLFGWCLVYVHVRYSSETWSAMFLVLALANLLKQKYTIWVGFLLGLSFTFRFQMGFALAGIALFLLINKTSIKSILKLCTGGLISIVSATMLDVLFYQKIVFTPYNYFYQNIINKVASGFGTSPWYWYITQSFQQLIPPYSLLVLAGFVLLTAHSKYRLIGFASLFFLLGHTIVAHKEMRFIFPLLFFAPLAAILSWQKVNQWLHERKILLAWQWLTTLFIAVNIVALLVVMAKPAHELANLYRFCYSLPQASTLYYIKSNPYLSGNNEATFYKKTDLKVLPLSEFEQGIHQYIFTEDNIKPEVPIRAELREVYNSIPAWLYAVNINNWISRANKYCVYEIVYH